MTTKREDLAWAAGFLDGEGYFGVQSDRSKYKSLTICVAQVHREVLDKLVRICGGRVYGPYPRRHAKGNPVYQWRAGGFANSQNVIAQLWDFLGIIKQAQARKALGEVHEYHKTAINKGGNRIYPNCGIRH